MFVNVTLYDFGGWHILSHRLMIKLIIIVVLFLPTDGRTAFYSGKWEQSVSKTAWLDIHFNPKWRSEIQMTLTGHKINASTVSFIV